LSIDPIANFISADTTAPAISSDTTVQIDLLDWADISARLPDGGFNMSWWDRNTHRDPVDDPDREIIRVTGYTAPDILVVLRAQEGTLAAPHPLGSRMVYGVTAKMITDLQDTIKNFSSANRKVFFYQALGGSTTYNESGVVVAGAIGLVGTRTFVTVPDTGAYISHLSAATINSDAGILSTTLDSGFNAFPWVFETSVLTGSSPLLQRTWVGCPRSDPIASDTPVEGACFRHSSSAGDTSWQAIFSTGTTHTIIPTGVVWTNDAPMRFRVEHDGSGGYTYSINGVVVAEVTTIALTSTLLFTIKTRTLEAVAKKIGISKIVGITYTIE